MYENQTEEIIKQRMLDKVANNLDKSEGSFINDAIAPAAVELAQSYIELDRVLRLVFASTSYGEYLDKRCSEFGILRKDGTKATGTVRFTGNNGVLIPAGTQIQTPGGLLFTTKIDTTIADNIADVDIEAAETGTLYNVPVGSITQIPVQIVGVISVTNSVVTGGTDTESDKDLQARLLLKVQTPSTSGNANDYKLWALSVEGVGDAKVFPTWNGNGTVKVVIIDANKLPASGALVSDVLDNIEANRPIGATVTVESATSLLVDISVTVTRDPAYSLQSVTDNIIAKLTAYFKSIAFKSSYVSYAQIGNIVIDSEGVVDYNNLTVNGGIVNINVGESQVAVLGTVTVT